MENDLSNLLLSSECVKNNSICDIFNGFNDFSKSLELTNVFQLRVDKAKIHLENLKSSIVLRGEPTGRQMSEEVSINRYVDKGRLATVGDLLAESCGLLCRLEADRAAVTAAVARQTQKVASLLDKISGISFIRMEMLPTAVQREHEACTSDISELQWHIKHRSQIEKKLRIKSNKAADINSELKKEIESIEEEIPLVREKLELEESMMQKIQETKEKLVHDSEASAERRRITQEKHDEANKKIDLERQHIKRDLRNANKALTSVQKSLQHGEKEYNKLLDFKAKNEKKIMENHAQIKTLNENNERKDGEQRRLEETVDKLNRKNRELKFDNDRLDKSLKTKQELLGEQEKKQEEIRSNTKNTKHQLDEKYVTLKRNNKEMEAEIKIMNDSQEKSFQDTEKIRVSIKNTEDDIREAEKRFQSALEEFTRVSKDHAAVQMRLTKETNNIREVEDRLKKTVSDIEQGIKQEVSTKSTFQTKMITDAEDLEASKKAAMDKRKEMQKAFNEATLLTKQFHDKVEIVDSQHQVTSEELRKLQSERDQLVENGERNKKEKQMTIERLTPIYEELQKKLDALVQEEEHVEWQIQTMNSQLTETSSAVAMISKSKKKALESMLEIDKNSSTMTVELEDVRNRIKHIEGIISQMETQSDRLRKTNDKYLKNRQTVLEQLEKELEDALSENKSLATQYRTSQTDFYAMQDAFLDVIQEQLWGEEHIRNIKELQRLQRYMHNNMEVFFSLKLVYDKDLFDDLRQENGRSEERIKQIRNKYLIYVDKMNEFLRNNFSNDVQILSEDSKL